MFTEVGVHPEAGGAPNFYYTVDEDAWSALPESQRKALVKPGGAIFDMTRDVWLKVVGSWCFGDSPDYYMMLHVVNSHRVEVGLDYTVYVHERQSPSPTSATEYSPSTRLAHDLHGDPACLTVSRPYPREPRIPESVQLAHQLAQLAH